MNRYFVLLSAFLMPMSTFAGQTCTGLQGADSAVLVDVNGTGLRLSDLERKDPAVLFQASNAFYEAERKAVNDFVDQYLLEQQAKKENLTVEQLLDKHVNRNIAKDPSEDALHVYYEGLDTKEPYEAVRGKILEALRQRRIAKAKAAYLQTLHDQARINVRLAPPRANISLKGTPVRGNEHGGLTLVEFADYECPYCQQAEPTLQKIEQDFKGKLLFAYKDTPLPMHPNAEKAAEAGLCAGAQGKFWEYHDLLFATKQLDAASLKQSARTLKLDAAAFDKCLDSSAMAEPIKTKIGEAQDLGIQGTPTLFINGRYFNGALGYEQLRDVLNEELKSGTAAPEVAQRKDAANWRVTSQ